MRVIMVSSIDPIDLISKGKAFRFPSFDEYKKSHPLLSPGSHNTHQSQLELKTTSWM